MTLKLLIIIYSFLNRGWVDFRFSIQYPLGFTFSVGLECNAQSSNNTAQNISETRCSTPSPLSCLPRCCRSWPVWVPGTGSCSPTSTSPRPPPAAARGDLAWCGQTDTPALACWRPSCSFCIWTRRTGSQGPMAIFHFMIQKFVCDLNVDHVIIQTTLSGVGNGSDDIR